MNKIIKEALIYILLGLVILIILFSLSKQKAIQVSSIILKTFKNTILIITSVFIIIGLIQVWIPSETIVKLLGEEAGFKGLLFASTVPLFIGGSLFTFLPLLKTLKDKGASISSIVAFIVAWGGKFPLIPLEIHFMGWKFALLRLTLNFPFAIIAGLTTQFLMDKFSKHEI